jgi:DNA-binding PadR family transcriptional regulator
MTNAELAILSLIAEKPRHGYEIEQVIEERGMRDWTEVGFSSIYYVLKKLEQIDLIASRTELTTGRGPARKIFTITPAGAQAHRAAIIDALSNPKASSSSFQLGLANLPGIEREEALAALFKYHDILFERREYLHTKASRGLGVLPYHVEAMFDLSLTIIQAELSWLEHFIHKLETREDDAD